MVSSLRKDGAAADVEEDDVAVVALGPAKVGVGDEVRVGVVGLCVSSAYTR